LAEVCESAVANNVTSIPLFTSPSVNKDTTDSHGPYFLGGVLHAIGDNIAILIIKPPKILTSLNLFLIYIFDFYFNLISPFFGSLESPLFSSNHLQYSSGHCVSGHPWIYSSISRTFALAIDTDTSALP
jgi:hypothetical protein